MSDGKTLKRVISRSSYTWIRCTWCAMNGSDRQGFELHKHLGCDHDRRMPCNSPGVQHVWFIFCSDRHLQYFQHSHIDMGKLPPGHRATL